MAAQLAAKDPASTADPALQSPAWSTSGNASSAEEGERLPVTAGRSDRSRDEVAFRVAAVAIKYYCRYVGFDAANRKRYITSPTSGSWVEACPAAERLCKSAGLRDCRKYGLFRTN